VITVISVSSQRPSESIGGHDDVIEVVATLGVPAKTDPLWHIETDVGNPVMESMSKMVYIFIQAPRARCE